MHELSEIEAKRFEMADVWYKNGTQEVWLGKAEVVRTMYGDKLSNTYCNR